METKALPDSAINASSFIAGREPWLARLNNVPIVNGHRGAWATATNEVGQWLQIDLGKERLLAKLATQGRPSDPSLWVTSYKIDFSSDSVKWEEYKENDAVKVCDIQFYKKDSDSRVNEAVTLAKKQQATYVYKYVHNFRAKHPKLNLIPSRFIFKIII